VPLGAAVIAFVVAAWSGLYQFLLADIVFGFQLSHLKVLPLLLFAVPLLPVAVAYVEHGSSRVLLSGLALIAVAAALVGWRVPAHTIDRPRGVNLVHVQEEGVAPAWIIESFGGPGNETLAAMGFDQQQRSIRRYGVMPREAHVRPAASLDLSPPVVVIDADAVHAGRRIIRGSVRSQRSAYIVMLGLPAAAPVERMLVEGQPVLDQASDQPRVVGLHGIGSAATRFEITARPGITFELVAADIAALELVGEAAQLVARRPATAAPLHNGDQSVVIHRVPL
jgi:hypothetical protein